MLQHTTIDLIVEDLKDQVSPDDLEYLRDGDGLDHVFITTQFLRWIRNNYEFWSINPLTERWRTDGPSDVRDGVDHSPDHPDNLSKEVFDRFLEATK